MCFPPVPFEIVAGAVVAFCERRIFGVTLYFEEGGGGLRRIFVVLIRNNVFKK